MELEEVKLEEPKSLKKPIKKKTSVVKKLDADSAKLLQSLKDQANKKTYGRAVRDSDILAIALKLVTSEHLKNLQDQSLTEKDRLAIAHEEYQRENGKLSLDAFIGKLLRGEKSKANTSP